MPDKRPLPTNPNSLLLAASGWIGVWGVFATLISNIIGSAVVPEYEWVADTISDLAAGRYEIIQDVGLYAFAGALLACAIGAAHVHPGTNRWTAGILGLSIMAGLVVVIGARNEYGDSDSVATWGVHLGLVYALMLLFLATSWAMSSGMGRLRPICRLVSLTCTGLFFVTGAAYFLVPTGYDGLVERAVVLVALVWVSILSILLLDYRRRIAD